jgi:hypothetical protein
MGMKSLAIILLLAAPAALRAQDRSPRLDLQLPPKMTARIDAPTATVQHVLAESHLREILKAGWPAKLHCRVELWRKGKFFWSSFDVDSLIEWDVIIEYLPATHNYQIRRQQDGKLADLGAVSAIEDAEEIIDRPYRVPLTPRLSGSRYFYRFTGDLSALSVSDLDAWQRWVRGDAEPAVRGKGNVISAIQHGLGSLLSRALGGETQHYEVRRPFTAG